MIHTQIKLITFNLYRIKIINYAEIRLTTEKFHWLTGINITTETTDIIFLESNS